MMYEPGYKASMVAPRLYVGPAPMSAADVRKYASIVVLCAKEHQPEFVGAQTIHAPLDDSGLPMTDDEIRIAKDAGKRVNRLIRETPVLVTCWQGRNRSGLVAALALLHLGFQPADAIEMVRVARGEDALRNPWFVNLIYTSKPHVRWLRPNATTR